MKGKTMYKQGMPKIMYINVRDFNQHENVLGKDEDNSKLSIYQLEVKHRAALRLFNAVAGYGNKGE
jgi:hypothetical protein